MADNYNRIIAQIKSKHFCSQHNTDRIVPELKHFIMFCKESLKYELLPSFKTVMNYFHLSLPYHSATIANESMNRQQ